MVVPSDWARGSEHRLKHRLGSLNIRKLFFSVRMTGHWHRLPKRFVESSLLEICKSHLDIVTGNQVQGALLQQGVRPQDLQKCPPKSVIL